MSEWVNNGNGTFTFTTNSGSKITLDGAGLINGSWRDQNIKDITTQNGSYHEYNNLTNLGYTVGQVSIETVIGAFRDNPTPFGAYFAGPGVVTHYSPSSQTILNVTTSAHALHPGVVQRDIVVIDNQYHVRTTGIGIGPLAKENKELAGLVWGQTDVNIMLSIKNRTGLPPNPLKAGVVPDLSLKNMAQCFLGGTMIDMWDGTRKPIEDIRPDDWVTSFTKDGRLVPGRVTRTFEKSAKYILDVHGLMMTPGHVTYCAKVAGEHNPYADSYVPIIDILRSDGALMKKDGTLIRASTGAPVGSLEDRKIWAVAGRRSRNSITVSAKGQIRLGVRYIAPDGTILSVLDMIASMGAMLNQEGLLVQNPGAKAGFIFHWEHSSMLPKPEDYVLQRSDLTLKDIYAADEWEAMRPQLPVPDMGRTGSSNERDSGSIYAAGSKGEDTKPYNIPLSMRGSSNQPALSRKQRRVMEAKRRVAKKRIHPTVH